MPKFFILEVKESFAAHEYNLYINFILTVVEWNSLGAFMVYFDKRNVYCEVFVCCEHNSFTNTERYSE